jgi:hypothetical protein
MYDEDYKKQMEQGTEVDICTLCPSRCECDRRDNLEPHILEMQYLYCHEKGRADYQEDDYWINKVVIEG